MSHKPAGKVIFVVDRWLTHALALMLVFASGSLTLADDYALEQDVMVSMRDGVRLATDVYRPAKAGVLVFQSEPLAEDVEVTGEIEVRLFASSSAVDTDFTAKLIDVYPPSDDWPGGFDLNIGDGIVRGRFRESLLQEVLMTPGETYEFTIKLYPTSNLFKRGHRIRVDVSSSNFPRFDVNPNTGEPLNRQRLSQVAAQTIYHDADRPSRIVLPIIPTSPLR